MSTWHPKYEGLDHINIYSGSKLPLGRALSNFFRSVFIYPGYGRFQSMEGFYYWLLTGKIHDELRDLAGIKAKEFGESKVKSVRIDKKFKETIQKAIAYKIMQNEYIQKLLIESHLPFAHYYYYGDPIYNVKIYDKYKKNDYMVHAIEEIRILLKKDGIIPNKYEVDKNNTTDGKSKRDSSGGKVHNDFKRI